VRFYKPFQKENQSWQRKQQQKELQLTIQQCKQPLDLSVIKHKALLVVLVTQPQKDKERKNTMAERDQTKPVLNTEEVFPADFHNNPFGLPIILQWRDRWNRENGPDFVGPPDPRNPLWWDSKTNTWTTEYERIRQIQDGERKIWSNEMDQRRRQANSQS